MKIQVDADMMLGVVANLAMLFEDYELRPGLKETLEGIESGLQIAIHGPGSTPAERHDFWSEVMAQAAKEETHE